MENKIMEAPEKIYFSGQQQYSNPFIGLMQKCADVEYTRTDAFIDKATEWLCNNYDKYIRVIGSSIYPAYSDLCRDFQNYMKEGGEE